MTVVRYVGAREMERRTGMGRALGYAFPDTDEILIRKGLPKDLEHEVRAHEAEHIEKGEEGPFIGALIGAGASILGGVLSSRGASRAADAQAQASREQIAFERESRDLALDLSAPQREAGYAATSALMDMTGLPRKRPSATQAAGFAEGEWDMTGIPSPFGGYLPQGGSGTSRFTAPDMGEYAPYQWQADPGYQFRMDEGMRALERGAAARGGLLSGGFARKALRYAQDYASSEYQNVYNRIASIAGFGQVATQGGMNAIQTASGRIGDAMSNAGAARASGYVAQGNAWANTMNQIGQIDWDSLRRSSATMANNYTGSRYGGYA